MQPLKSDRYMLNLILGKPKLDFYLEIALAHLSQLEFKVCKIAPQAGFLRFWQAKIRFFFAKIGWWQAQPSFMHTSELLTDSQNYSSGYRWMCSESKVFPSHSLATDKIIQVQPRSLSPPNTQPAAPLCVWCVCVCVCSTYHPDDTPYSLPAGTSEASSWYPGKPDIRIPGRVPGTNGYPDRGYPGTRVAYTGIA